VETTRRHVARGVLSVLVFLARPAGAVEIRGGVSVGGFQAGTASRLAVSPHAGLSWRRESGLLFAAHDLFSVLPVARRGGVGIYNQTSLAIGYASKEVDFSVGPTLAIYSMTACGVAVCGRVAGLGPGGQAQLNLFLYGQVGLSANGYVNWLGGRSQALPGGVAAMVVAGPVIRWDSRQAQ
jgi:hypothetical protein